MLEDSYLIQALKRQSPERVPVIYCGPGCNGVIEGKTLGTMRSDAKVMLEVENAILEKVGCDWMALFTDAMPIPEALGCKAAIHEDRMAEVAEGKVIDDFESFGEYDLEGTYSCKAIFDAVAEAATYSEVPLSTTFEGPLTTCFQIFGADDFLPAMIEDPELVHEAIKATADVLCDFVEIAASKGVTVFFLPDPCSSKNMISQKHFIEFAQPYQKQVIDKMHAMGALVILHICGDTIDRIVDMADTGADGLSVDYVVDIAEAIARVEGRSTIVGNVDPVSILMRGTPEDVVAATAACMEKAGSTNFVMMPGCAVPPGVSLENLQAMAKTAKEWKY